MNPLHRLAIGEGQQDGAVVDDDLDRAVVVLDVQLVVLDGIASLGNTVGAAEVEKVVIEENEHIVGEEREHVVGEIRLPR